ncbi:hypothetical protein N7468_004247 [Penicillium chermesinum]|uniref:Uncharacterized protein n=1 Tax=Penicillium chermesinum TaxID=63820 RepID=A0A9W9P833_9EURO|nr:uncharacterized protein N7468_004247 [Penicillium chermesinum]KAJ5239628.1 hypothetical protein N7468_004247 [Penicillium chermesinum]
MGSNDRRASNVKEVSGFDSSSIDSCGRNPNAGGENLDSTSSTLNQGSGGIDTSNKMDSRRTSDLGAYYGTNTVGTHAMRQQSDKSGPNYGSNVDRNFSSGKRNSNVAMIQDPVESEMNNPIGNQGFGGGAAADGSSNQGKSSSGRRRSSGPHNSNLLNKLDPRVRSSDYKENTAVDQRRKY